MTDHDMSARAQMERSLDRWMERARNARSDADETRAEREIARLREELDRLS